jgi:DNA-binding XRE family transcriptional regulator
MSSSKTSQAKHAGGRPLKVGTLEQLDLAIQNYFAECDPHTTKALVETGRDSKGNMLFDTRTVLTEQRPYLVTGLALALGVSRQTLLNYRERDKFFDSITMAVQRCEAYAESQLYGPFANGARFNLINNYKGKHQDWAERSEVDHTTKGETLSPYTALTTDELRKLAGAGDAASAELPTAPAEPDPHEAPSS